MCTLPRVFVDASLSEGQPVRLDPPQAHYLRNVLRLGEGDPVRLFNGLDGEWLAELEGGRNGPARVLEALRPQAVTDGPWLVFAPLKKDATDYLIQKSVELGCSRLQPVHTRRTQGRSARPDRYRPQAVEAAEQCERLDLPVIGSALSIEELVRAWPAGRTLFVALERDDTTLDALPALQAHAGEKVAFLIGPEGGLAPEDLEILSGLNPVYISLGPRILRAETACVAALALWQASAGDWPRRAV
ncbi:16S rRNA (uracil(1498)-N(3))-methyltransferase [Phaeovibrio sulfidiphilus]|uniref:Ribosomal RNA small subunit methyltransferase E n=1 Tax=Phaeovibrio sulfidiphilus TaxID=1220600 RepID=A0A8J6YKY9_9PROT|nr:16S rRNA (uracil(1498)-N(3))-methyltransferase [Phaeovibrio sulfidiphilus]